MAKNGPARERNQRRAHGQYAANGKASHIYNITKGAEVPLAMAEELYAARVAAFGHGYKDEKREVERLAVRRARAAR